MQTVSSSELQIMLLEAKVDPNVVNKIGNTPLHLCKSSELMAALLTAGADPNAKNQVNQPFSSFILRTAHPSAAPTALALTTISPPHRRRPA